ncbi:MAG: hypothetical protein HZA65_07980 [Rhodocyclales bacterium]|nr:hypothetical protein [Rhodocyclales bacterium]
MRVTWRGAVAAVFLWVALAGQGAKAQESPEYTGCTDAKGQAVAVREDPKARRVFEVRLVEGVPVIVHNPTLLPDLWPVARRFLFAHACVRIQAGYLPPAPQTVAQDRSLDCQAVEWLVRNGRVRADDIGLIETALNGLRRRDWRYVAEGPRRVEVAACYQRIVESLARNAEGTKRDWSRCVEVCGEQMVDCRATGGRVGETTVDCMQVYLICIDICNRRYP